MSRPRPHVRDERDHQPAPRMLVAGLLAVGALAVGGLAPVAQAATPSPQGGGPVNDYFSDATAISGFTGSIDGYNWGATPEEGEPNIPADDEGPYGTVWYAWTAPADGDVTFDTCTEAIPPLAPATDQAQVDLTTGSGKVDGEEGFDSKIGAYLGDRVWDLESVAFSDDTEECDLLSKFTMTVTSGTVYRIQVDGFNGSTGAFVLTWGLPKPPLTLSISGWSGNEGDSGTTPYVFTVLMSDESESPVTVDWQTNDGTATAPGDYTNGSGTLTIAPGDTTATVIVDVVGDTELEGNEAFTVILSEPDGAELDQATATGTILNDEASADLTVYVDTFGGKAEVGGYLPYFVQVFNAAGGSSSEATATVGIPAHTTVNYLGASQGSCVEGEQITCSFGSIESGGSAYAIVYLIADRTGLYRNNVSVTGSVQDPDELDNVDSNRKEVFPNKDGCTMTGTKANDFISGTKGDDVICTYGGEDRIHAGAGNDTIYAGLGNDSMVGGPGVDQIFGNGGNDLIMGGADPDQIDGGSGFDTVTYALDPAGVVVNLLEGTATDGYAAVDGVPSETITSVFAVIGSAFGDSLTGDGLRNEMLGGAGDDSLWGLAGRDWLDGGDDVDSLDGGASPDDTCLQGETYKSCEL